MQSDYIRKENLIGGLQDIEIITVDDVMMEHDGALPSISFSSRIHDQLVQSWKNAIIVKLFRKSIGYHTLCISLEGM